MPHRPLLPCAGSSAHVAALPDEDLIFVCVQGSESFLWRSEEAGPVRLTPSEVFVRASRDVALSGGRIFFAASDDAGQEPWVSDGTPGGTRRLADLDPGGGSEPAMFTAFAGRVWFTAYSMADESVGRELWVTVEDPVGLTLAGSRVFLSAGDPVHGRELWTLER